MTKKKFILFALSIVGTTELIGNRSFAMMNEDDETQHDPPTWLNQAPDARPYRNLRVYPPAGRRETIPTPMTYHPGQNPFQPADEQHEEDQRSAQRGRTSRVFTFEIPETPPSEWMGFYYVETPAPSESRSDLSSVGDDVEWIYNSQEVPLNDDPDRNSDSVLDSSDHDQNYEMNATPPAISDRAPLFPLRRTFWIDDLVYFTDMAASEAQKANRGTPLLKDCRKLIRQDSDEET